MRPYKVGIVGLGTMGTGIARWLVRRGHEVFLRARRPEAVDSFAAALERSWRTRRHLSGRVPAVPQRPPRSLIHPVRDDTELEGLDLVIESVAEDLRIKRSVLSGLDQSTGEGTLLATTTSSLSVAELAEGLDHPGRFLGMHFFSPVTVMELVEVASGGKTASKAVGRAIRFVRDIGKEPLCVKDGRGFLVNRLFGRFLGQAAQMLETGAGSIEEIDRELSCGLMLNGPFFTADFVGLDILLEVNRNLNEWYGREEPGRFPLSASLEALCNRGRLGRRAGKGYYRYTPQGAVAEEGSDEELAEILDLVRSRAAKTPVPLSREHALCALIEEASLCLEEGVVERAEDIDFAMKRGMNMFKGPFETMGLLGLGSSGRDGFSPGRLGEDAPGLSACAGREA